MTDILFIDDDTNLHGLVSAYLVAEGFTIHTAADGAQGLALFRRHRPALIILDVMLPARDGFDLLAQIRRESSVYVLMLTARSEETDRVVGLTLGADDYLTKPFSPRELVARVRAVLRRSRDPEAEGSPDDRPLIFRRIRIDPARHEVWRDETRIDLTALEFRLLRTLARYPGMVLSREQLIEQVWGHDFYGDDRVVDVHIGHIRQKIEPDTADAQFIITVRGVGYKFADGAP
jgi:two-component system alkaline phosphatase synthesis response regulator PhoP